MVTTTLKRGQNVIPPSSDCSRVGCDLLNACPDIPRPTVNRALQDMQRDGEIECVEGQVRGVEEAARLRWPHVSSSDSAARLSE
jgi:hypothetical protein